MAWLTDPLHYEFMQRGLAAGVLVGALCAVIGCYVVLRGMAFLGDAIAHAILPGVAVAYLLGLNLVLGASIAAAIVAVGVVVLSRREVVREDTAIGILFSAALALGVVLVSTMRNYAVDLTHILFGNVLGVSAVELAWIAGLGTAVLAVVVAGYRAFLLVSFDPVLAKSLRWPVERWRSLQLVLLALTVVAALKVVGVALAVALLITPAAAASLLAKRLAAMMLLAAAFGAVSGVLGMYISYYADVASGGTIVLVATGLFGLAYVVAKAR